MKPKIKDIPNAEFIKIMAAVAESLRQVESNAGPAENSTELQASEILADTIRRFNELQKKVDTIEGFNTTLAKTTDGDLLAACAEWNHHLWGTDGDCVSIKIPVLPISDDFQDLFSELIRRFKEYAIDRTLQSEALDIIRMAANSAKLTNA